MKAYHTPTDTHPMIKDMLENVGPLNQHTRLLFKLTALAIALPVEQLKTHLSLCLENGIAPSEIYQALFSISDILGMHDTMVLVASTQQLIHGKPI